ncbi:Silent information regulator protein Sir2 [Coraliomargarita akajimensis DSM 45221]|uniref:NAD-dependent protein deacylase n=2 Tax=Coraliomargarita TaxID=442430 RepID=D5ENI1_CORAD|nr:Silent information regulator protein Sir2 [Coraliomargarita akajimensis DSM 45221]
MARVKLKVVVFSGAGMSAESGLQTFRGAGGLWEGHPVEAVATPEAWDRDPALVLRFYNERRRQLRQVKPNAGHLALAALEANYDVHVVTQNVDDLHERGGSTRVLHLHGQLMQARSTVDEACITELKGRDIELGDRCVRGGQLRPNIVWFGEAVPAIERAIEIVRSADILLVVGTSLQVYPAAALVHEARAARRRIYVDPHADAASLAGNFERFSLKAAECLPSLVEELCSQAT